MQKRPADTESQLRNVLAWGNKRDNKDDMDEAMISIQELKEERDAIQKQLEEQKTAMSNMKAEKTAEADKLVDEYKAKLKAEESKRRDLEVEHAAVMREME